jgi:hypothetical protein
LHHYAGDYGTMHAIGTHVHLDGVTTSAYKANEAVDEALLRGMVVSLAEIGRCAFSHQVYFAIRDTEGNCGLHPVVPMDGEGGRRVGNTVNMSVLPSPWGGFFLVGNIFLNAVV